MMYEVTRADNKLTRGAWRHKTSEDRSQSFAPHYAKEVAINYFMMHHAPRGKDISREGYEKLRAEYEAAARAN